MKLILGLLISMFRLLEHLSTLLTFNFRNDLSGRPTAVLLQVNQQLLSIYGNLKPECWSSIWSVSLKIIYHLLCSKSYKGQQSIIYHQHSLGVPEVTDGLSFILNCIIYIIDSYVISIDQARIRKKLKWHL